MPLYAGESGGSGKKKKKKPPTPSPSYTTPSESRGPTYSESSYSAPASPSYTTPSESRAYAPRQAGSTSTSYQLPSYFRKPPEPKQPSFLESLNTLSDSITPVEHLSGMAREIGSNEDDLTTNQRRKKEQVKAKEPTLDLGSLLKGLAESVESKTSSFIEQTTEVAGNVKDFITPGSEEPERDLTKLTKDLKRLNWAPKGTEIPLPQRYMYQSNKKGGKRLDWWWDQDTIKATLNAYLEAGDEFGYEKHISDVMTGRYKDKINFAYDRTNKKFEAIEAALDEAQDEFYNSKDEGPPDFNVLAEYMEDHPKFDLDPLKYREDYGITPESLREEMRAKLRATDDPLQQAEIRKPYETFPGTIQKYEEIRKVYQTHAEMVQDRIDEYEAIYNDKVEDMGVEDEVGPAIPERIDQDAEQTEALDQYAKSGERWKLIFMGQKGVNKARRQEKRQIEQELGVKLPSVRQMLMVQVQAGNLDPENTDQVHEFIERYKNPAHPETRGMYAALAKVQNPDLKDKELEEFINRDFKNYIKGMQEWAREQEAKSSELTAEQKDWKDTSNPWDFVNDIYNQFTNEMPADSMETRVENVKDWDDVTGVRDFFSDVGNRVLHGSLNPAAERFSPPEDIQALGADAEAAWWSETEKWGEYVRKGANERSPLLWTLDKALRPLYAMAGGADKFTALDKDDTPWSEGNLAQRAVSWLGLMAQPVLGTNPADSLDEFFGSSEARSKVFNEMDAQFFRGSGLAPHEVEMPTTFGHVIARNAARDPEINRYDSENYQFWMGLAADMFLDPTTYVGVGFIGSGAKLGAKASKGLARDAVMGTHLASEKWARMVYGNAVEDALKFKNMQSHTVLPKKNWVSGLYRPDASRYAKAAWAARHVLTKTERSATPTTKTPYSHMEDAPKLPDDPTPAQIQAHVEELAVREDAVINDIAVEGFREDVIRFVDDHEEFAPTPGMGDVRIEKALKRGKNQSDFDFYNLKQQYGDVAEKAGFTRRTYKTGDEGTAARQADEEIAQINSRYGAGEALPAAMQKRVDELTEIYNKGTNIKPDTKRAFDEGVEAPEIVAQAKAQIANAYKGSADEFPFTDAEVLRAVVDGPDMLRRLDPDYRARWDVAYARLDKAKRDLQRFADDPKKYPEGSPVVQAARMNYNEALDTLNVQTVGGAIHFLDYTKQIGPLVRTQDGSLVRSTERAVYKEPERGAHLESVLEKVKDRRQHTPDTAGSSPVAKTTNKPTDHEVGLEARPHENIFRDADFDEPLDDILVRTADDFYDTDAQLKAVQEGIEAQLKSLRIDEGGKLTGLPPMKAARLKASAPPRFKGEDGKLNAEKLAEYVYLQHVAKDSPHERWIVSYKSSGLSDLEKAFVRNFATTLREFYRDDYLARNIAAKSDVTGQGVTTKAQHVYDPKTKGPHVAVVIGSHENPKAVKALKEQMGDDVVESFTDWGRTSDDLKLRGSHLRDVQNIHQAIKAADEQGIAPVVYVFTKQDLMHPKNDFLRQTIEYAQERGVTVGYMDTRQKAAKLHMLNAADKSIPKYDMSAPVRSTRAGTAWDKKFKQGIKGPQELLKKAWESGRFTDFYNTLFLPGSPFNVTARTFTQTDDVIGRILEKADDISRTVDEKFPEITPKKGARSEDAIDDSVSEVQAQALLAPHIKRLKDAGIHVNAPGALVYNGKTYDANFSKARAQLRKDVGPKQANQIMEDYAHLWFDYLNELDPAALRVLFKDIYVGARKSAQRSYNRRRLEAFARARGQKVYSKKVDAPVWDNVGEGLLDAPTLKAVREESFKKSLNKLVDEVNTKGSLPGTATGRRMNVPLLRDETPAQGAPGEVIGGGAASLERRTVNQTARDLRKELRRDFRLREAEALDNIANAATKEEAQAAQEVLEGIRNTHKQAIHQVEVTRKATLEAKKVLTKDAAAEAITQITMFPGRDLTEAQLRKLSAAKQADQEAGINRLNEPELAASATAHKYFGSMTKMISHLLEANFKHATRPSRQLKGGGHELREILALAVGATPVIIKNSLENINRRMGGMLEQNRIQAFAHLRSKIDDYTGPQMEKFQGVKDEMDEIASIWNAKHDDYKFALENRPAGTSFVTWSDMVHWLPKHMMPDLKVLSKARKKARNGELTIGDIWNAIPAANRTKGTYDPAVFAHTMRLAASQARAVRFGENAINVTFGVPRQVVFKHSKKGSGKPFEIKAVQQTDQSREIEDLAKLGWRTIDALGNTHYFHPGVVDEIENLHRLMTKADARTQFMKLVDSGISGWKGLHTTYSPPYYVRNLVGEILMGWLGGVSNPMYYNRAIKGMRWLRKDDRDLADLVGKLPILEGKIPVDVVEGTAIAATLRNGTKLNWEQVWSYYVQHGLKSTFTNTEIRAHGARRGAGAIMSDRKTVRKIKQGFNKVHDYGEGMEDFPRMAHFIHALEHSKKGTQGAITEAAQKVRKYHFDYSDVSTLEKITLGRAFPFFKWTRFAAPVMLSHLVLKPGRVTAPYKVMNTTAGVLSSDDIFEDTNGHLPSFEGMGPSWVRDFWGYNISGLPGAEDEYSTYLRVATPQTDVLAQMDNPINTAQGLLNPAIKALVELSQNHSMDPDFANMPIRGGDFNEMYNINDLEALGMYAGKQLGPFAKTASDLYKLNQNYGDTDETYGDYKEEQGYSTAKQLISNLSGLSMYQAKNFKPEDEGEVKDEPFIPTAVAPFDLPKDLRLTGRKARPENDQPVSGDNLEEIMLGLAQKQAGEGGGSGSGWVDYPERSGNGWVDFGSNGWINYGSGGGYGGGYSSGGSSGGGYSFSRAEWSDALAELIKMLKSSIDQGDVAS